LFVYVTYLERWRNPCGCWVSFLNRNLRRLTFNCNCLPSNPPSTFATSQGWWDASERAEFSKRP